MHHCTRIGLVVVAWIGFASPSPGQSNEEQRPGQVSGTGTASIDRMPQVMRMQVNLLAKGSKLEDALKELKEREGSARTQLAALGAAKDSIRVESPQVSSGQTEQQRQVAMFIAQRTRNSRRKTAKAAVAPVSMAALLTAEWPLQAETVEDLLLAVHGIQEKVKAADLAGAKEASKLSPEEQELLEEMESGGYGGYSGEEGQPGEPMFVFVSPITGEERDKALAEAFEKARQSATRLARAAEADLGALRLLSDDAPMTSDYSEYAAYGGDARSYQLMQLMQARRPLDPDRIEAMAAQPGRVTYRVNVTASFDLKMREPKNK